jgi:transcriptional regulator with XRE-family HTH domain
VATRSAGPSTPTRRVRAHSTKQGAQDRRFAEQSGVERTYLAKLEAGMTTLLVDRTLRLLRRLGARLVVELPDVELPDGVPPERAGNDQGPGRT